VTSVRAITYCNTKTTLPGWVPTIHQTWSRGFAYELGAHFVHIFGFDKDLWTITDVVATQRKQGQLKDWVQEVFGGTNVAQMSAEVGHSVQSVWRPGLFYDVHTQQGLAFSPSQLRLAEQSLLLLVQRLDELLLFVEPDGSTLSTFSHKARELLILACTECENYWQDYLREANSQPINGRSFTTNDYVKLAEPLYLAEFEISMPRYQSILPFRPFLGWSAQSGPTQSLPWYDDYNKTKHDRTTYFSSATLLNCVKAVAATTIMFAVRFGPYHLTSGTGTLPALINHLYLVALCNPKPESFYVPLIKEPTNSNLSTARLQDLAQPMVVDPFHV
jgi:hypothetical protein